MSFSNGIKIKAAKKGFAAYLAGLRANDNIISINNETVKDDLDFSYLASAESNQLIVRRKDIQQEIVLSLKPNEADGLEFYEKPVRRCGNRCIFCFIDQMPKGFRKSLYVKDEDFRHSFLFGNYVTLSNASEDDLRDIIRLRLSPLYVSVHSTDITIRNRMLCNSRSPDINKQLRYLIKNKIQIHSQIVVCPEYNTGKILLKSIKDLLALGPRLLSIAVVPVGLTRFHKNSLHPVSVAEAVEICGKVKTISNQYKTSEGHRRLFLADEFFIKAKLPIPPASYYEEYPQIENGVGLLRSIMDDWATLRKKIAVQHHHANRSCPIKKWGIITGESALPWIKKIINEMNRYCNRCEVEAVSVTNAFFGSTVTVTGLLTARDILSVIHNHQASWDGVIIPQVIFNLHGCTLDGFSLARMKKNARIPLCAVGSMNDVWNTINAK